MRLALSAAMLFLIAGCTMEQRTPGPEPVNTTPIQTDPAMQARNWDPSVANYASDMVMAWPDYTPLRPQKSPMYEAPFTETALFIANTAYAPFGLAADVPAWKMVGYKSMSMEPTYTAMPPLPPSTQPSTEDLSHY